MACRKKRIYVAFTIGGRCKDIIFTQTSNEGLAKGSLPNVEHKAPFPKI